MKLGILMVVVAVGGVIVVGAFGVVRQCTALGGADQRTAESEAVEFGKQLGLNVKSAVCAKMDSDGDGYVSCTLSVDEGGKVRLEPIECAAALRINSGCRVQKMGGLRQ